MTRYILIDWDNTIWDFSANSALSLGECYNEFHLNLYYKGADEFAECYYRANDTLWARYRRGEIDRKYLVEHRFLNTLKESASPSGKDEDIKTLSEKINDAYIRNVEYKSELVPGAREILEYLRGKGYVLIVITNGFSEVQQRKLRNSGVEHLFDFKVLSDNAGALKPSREFFDYTFSHTGAVPEESLVIGDDSEADIAGAVEYGLRCVYFNRFHKACPYPADYEITDLWQLKDIL